jgi:hypothetical protein
LQREIKMSDLEIFKQKISEVCWDLDKGRIAAYGPGGGVEQIVSIFQIITDPENQPHQWSENA